MGKSFNHTTKNVEEDRYIENMLKGMGMLKEQPKGLENMKSSHENLSEEEQFAENILKRMGKLR